jgi:hypothetical protein
LKTTYRCLTILFATLKAKNINMKQSPSAYESITNDKDDTAVGGCGDNGQNWEYIKAEVL